MTIKFFCRVYSASSACIRKTFLFNFILFNGFLVVADQSIYVGSSVDPPTSQNFAISHESSSDIKNSSIKSLEKISMSQEMTTEMSKSYDTSLNSPEKNEICLDVMVLTCTEEKTSMSPNEDVLENIENLKKKRIARLLTLSAKRNTLIVYQLLLKAMIHCLVLPSNQHYQKENVMFKIVLNILAAKLKV